MTKQELLERLGALAERQFFDKGDPERGLEAYQAMGIDPPPRLFISCGCALWREGRYYQAATAFARAPLELVRDHLKACRVECLRHRQVAHAVAIARMEGVCIKEELKACATDWRKQGHIGEAVAAYQSAGIDISELDFKSAGRAFMLMGSLDVALDAFEAAGAEPPFGHLQDWLKHRPVDGGDPWLQFRVLRTLLRHEEVHE